MTSLNQTPSGQRVHIAFFGRRNAGKSSLLNAITNQALAVVSPTPGTTTDPVYKAMELLPLGPVMLIDTPGMDDIGTLGAQRVEKAQQVLAKTQLAILVLDATVGITQPETALIAQFTARSLPYLLVYNKADLLPAGQPLPAAGPQTALWVSAKAGTGIEALRQRIAALAPKDTALLLVKDLLHPGDLVLLVVPIDSAAPKGRLILPQQQVLREVLDADGWALAVQDSQLAPCLAALPKPPALVITDSQIFSTVAPLVPPGVHLTSFSILMARHKGFLQEAVQGIAAINTLKAGDTLLIAEGCTHHRQCEDIGTVKLPRWLRAHVGADLKIKTCCGTEFPPDLTPYKLVLHCGGCMLNPQEVQHRMQIAQNQGVPFTNYGIAIAYMQGILPRSLSLFPHLQALL